MTLSVCVCPLPGGGVPLWKCSRNKKGGVGVTVSASDPTTGSQGGGGEGPSRTETHNSLTVI